MLIIENDLLKKEWNTRKNDEIGLDPAKLVVGSNKYAFWKCSVCGNEWKAQIAKRGVRGQGCPVCAKTKQIKGLIENKIKIQGSLSDNYPDIAAEWNYEKNTERPEGVLSGSNQKVFWICSKCGHTWKASIASRVKGAGCPICGRKKGKESLLRGLIKANGSLADNAPEIAAEWDYSKNEELTPNQVMLKTNKSVWWICSECGYSWKTKICNRAIGRGCPKCGLIKQGISLSKPIDGVNDLLSQAPELAEEWHPYKNEGLKPSDVTKSSNKKVWWLGKCGHEWQAVIGSRFAGRGCPLCLKEFKISYPEKAVFYYLEKFLDCVVEENYKPDWLKGKELDIYIPSLSLGIEYDGKNWHKNVDSDIEKNRICQDHGVDILRIREKGLPELSSGNVYEIIPDSDKDDELQKAIEYVFKYISDVGGMTIPYTINLSGDRAYIYDLMEINRKENSLAKLYSEIAKEWHTRKNGNLTPEYVNAHSHRKYWWICPQGHEYEMVVKHRIEKNACCPICSNHRVLAGYNDLEYKRPELVKYWDYERNGDLLPSQVMEYSNQKVWWKCEKGHSYLRMISHQSMRDSGCPVCKMQVLQEGISDLETLYPQIAAEWDYTENNGLKPNMITPISHKRVNWVCKTCGWKWNISVNSRCILGHGCPKCAGKKRWDSRKKM